MTGGPATQPDHDDRRPPAPLRSTWAVAAAAGEPVALVRVRGLQGTLRGAGRDAWGRGRRAQPALVSAEVSFAAAFGASAASDRVGAETAHYGTLSRALLTGLERLGGAGDVPPPPPKTRAAAGGGGAEDGAVAGPSSADALELLWAELTGRVVDGGARALPLDQLPFLDLARLRSLALTVHLPKASLVGTGGVSLTATAGFRGGPPPDDDDDGGLPNPQTAYARRLTLHGLHVPTLVGVNANERLAKQMVVADVEVDRLDVTRDVHPELERLVVETMEASSFETLEALGALIAEKILNDFKIGDDPKPARERGWQVKVSLAKPIAVPFADSPEVVVRAGGGI